MHSRLFALCRKEFYQIIRDPSSILISVVLPLILLFLYGYGVSLDVDNLRIGIVMEDTSPDARSFAQSLSDSPYFDVQISRDRRQFDRDIVRGAIRGFVVIPSYFSAFRYRPETIAPIQVIGDGSETNTANFVQNYVQSAFSNWLQQEGISRDLRGLPLLNIQPRFWYNEDLESRNFLIPGSLAIIMTLIGTLLTALVVAREWERGTMEALMSTPVTIRELIIGKLIPYYILGMLSMLLCMLVAVFFYEVPFRGSYLVLFVVSTFFLYAALSTGLLISTLAKNQFVAAQMSLVTAFLPAFMLSGFIFEISSMPFFIRMITYLIPARYFVSALKTLFLMGNVWQLLFLDVLFLFLFGSLLLAITSHKTVKRLD